MKIRFKELASRLTGVSLPVFGVSWNPPEPERKIVRETLVFLEDRRALYNDFAHEIEDQVAQSVLQIRTELTNAIRRLSEDAEAGVPNKITGILQPTEMKGVNMYTNRNSLPAWLLTGVLTLAAPLCINIILMSQQAFFNPLK